MRYNKITALSLLCMVISFLLCQGAHGTTMKRLGISELTKASSHVVYCTVRTIKSSWNEGKTSITTDIELDVSEVVKGTIHESTIVLKMLGGKMDGRTTMVVGAPSFEVGEEVVLFLKILDKQNVAERDRYRLVGLAQGKFSVQYDKTKKAKVAVSNAGKFGLSIVPDKPTGDERIEEKQGYTLDEFFQKIKSVESN